MRPLSAIESANEELRQLRKDLGRGGTQPLRLVVAGDPTKPLLTFTLPRRLPATLGAIVTFSALATMVGGWGGPEKALAALSAANIYATHDDNGRDEQPSRNEAALAASAQVEAVPPTMQMHAVPEGEHFTVEISNTGKVIEVYLKGPAGEPDEASYRALRHELRCQRSGAESPIDPRMVEILHQISLSTGQRIQVVSAFRGQTKPGDFNYHTRGMAADIRVPGVDTADLRDLARSLGATGVGYYPTVQFVHVDVRSVPYFWTDTSGHGDHSRDEDRAGAPEIAEAADSAAELQANGSAGVSAEVAAILRPPGGEAPNPTTPAIAAPSLLAPLVVPAAVTSLPRAKAAGNTEPLTIPAKSN